MLRTLAAAAIAASVTAPSFADGWSFRALEDGFDQETCMNRARAVLDIYARRFGANPERVESEWSVAGYGVASNINTTFICRTEGGADPVWLITHSTTSGDDQRQSTHNRIRDLWNAPK
jgi:hypothetical protein